MSNESVDGDVDDVSYILENKETSGLKTLMGDPKKAMIKLSLPMILAMSIQTLYNLVDTFWVSGLGADALAATGFVFPFFFITIALSNGLGMGAGAAISRRLGARDKNAADKVASNSMIMMLLLCLAFTVPFFVYSRELFLLVGAGKTVELAIAYGRIIFAGSIFIFFTNVANSILRSEGDTKRAMHAMIIGAVLNIILDPIFIYTFDMGIAGAAWATILSLAISSVPMFNWLFLKRDTYISFNFKNFRFEKDIIHDIFRVGVPASIEHSSMALSLIMLNLIVVLVDSTDGVAVYSVGWRVASIAIQPLIGIATAVITMAGFSYGARSFKKIDFIHIYATKIGFLIELVISLFTYFLAPQIAHIFTMSENAAHITDELIVLLRILCIFYPMISLGMMSSSLFQGTGKGMNSLASTIIRSLILAPLFAFLLGSRLDLGITGVWWGIVIGHIVGSLIPFIWARLYIAALNRTN
ncbi:MATE family efflux transporter [Methanolobus sp. ZRKC3]|uniref:MATE family efflux transporter n=1 Tax=Methanolobus sp. ZRKC3 TaxID=3125786 RepID=UPI00325169FC